MEKRKKETKPLNRKSLKISSQNKEAKINPVRNSSGPSPRRPAAMVREHGGSGSGHAGGALKPAAESFDPEGLDGQRSIISNRVKNSYQESESTYKILVEASLQGIVIAQGIPPRLVYANPAISRILDYSSDELTSLTFKQTENLIHPDDRSAFFSRYKDRLEGKPVPPNYEIRGIRKDGSTVWLELSATQIEYNGEPAVLATYVDITERKRAEEALRASEERYRAILKNIEDGYFEVDIAGNFTFFNNAVCRLLGYSSDEMVGMNNRQYMDEENAKKLYQAFNTVYRTGIPIKGFEWEVIKKDGTKQYGEVSISLIRDLYGQAIGFRGIARDTTERKQAEEALRKSEEKYRLVSESIPVAVYSALPDEHSTNMFISGKMEELTGYPGHQLIEDPELWMKVIHPEDREQVWREIEKHRREIKPLDIEYRLITRDNITKWIKDKAIPALNEKGEIIRIDGFMEDITEYKRAEAALQQSEERYRTLVEESFDGIFIQKGFKIVFANRRLYEMLGYGEGELEGLDHYLVYHPDYQVLTRKRAQARMRGESIPSNYEVKFLRKDGSSFWGEIHAKVISFLGEPGIQVWARDISERKKTEEAIHLRDAILQAVSFAAESFLKSADWEKSIQEVLMRLGKEAGVSRVYIFENHPSKEGEILTSQRYEWVAPSITPQIDNPDLQNFSHRANGLVRWEEMLSQGHPIQGHLREFPESEREVFSAQSIQSLVVLPIFIEQEWWGFIGFDECLTERQWSVSEVDALKIAAGTLGAAIQRKQTEETLRAERERFRSLSEDAPFGMAMIDKDGAFKYINSKFKELFGYDLNDIPDGKTWFRKAYPDPDYRHHVISTWLNDLASLKLGEKRPRVFTAKCNDGSEKIVNFIPVQLGAGENLLACEDITDLKRAEETLRESEERYRTILENVEDGYYEVDLSGNLTFFNDSLCRMLGYARDEMIGMGNQQYTDEENRKKLFQAFNEVYKTGKPTKGFDWKVFRKDGKKLFGEVSVSLVKDSKGQPIGFRGIARDITERKQAEEALRSEHDKFRGMLLALGDGVDIINKNYIIEFQNEFLREHYGDKIGEKCFSAYMGLERPCDFCSIQEAIRTGQPTRIELVAPNDRNYELNSSPFMDVDGEVKVIELVRDITERKQAEEALRQSEERYRTILENIEDGYYEVDIAGNVTFCNDSFGRLFGYSKDEMMGMNNRQYTDEENAQKMYQAFNKVYRTGEPTKTFDLEVIRKDGTKVFGEVSVSLMTDAKGQPIGFRGIARDITERKQAEEALRRSEESSREVAKENAIMAEIGRIISSTLNIDEVYERFIEEVNKLIPFDRVAINILDPKNNKATVAYVTGVDVPDARKGNVFPFPGSANEEILRTRSSLLLQVEDMDDFQHRFPGLFTTYQAGLRSMMSVPLFSKDQIIGVLHIRSFNPNAYSARDLGLAERVGHQIAGAIANAQLFKELMQAEEDKIAIQEQFRQSQKMEAIGGLAGGIAHDFNNLLTVIKGYAELSCLGLDTSDPLRGNIEEILKASERATNLTRQLLAFSRRQILDFKVINLNTLLKDLDKMLHRILGEDIDLAYHLSEDIGKVKTDPGQIEQVILNLAVNSRDAMPSGGKLTIETLNVELDEAYARTHMETSPGHYVMFSVSDSGAGIPPEVRERIFEPFFTTKEKGKGTGLGLSTVYGIVKQSGGNINVYSEPGLGTTFKIYLPRVEEEEDHLQRKDLDISLLTGNETILLAEDEQSVRELAARILRQRGYQVYEAPDGNEALAIAQKHSERIFHLLLTDVVMPGMSGKNLADCLKLSMPDIKVLFISGYTDNAIVHHGVLDKGVNFIQKPFSMESLARKVREVLDR